MESESEDDEDEEESESSEEEPPAKLPPKKVLRVRGPKLTQAKLKEQGSTRATRSKTHKDATMQKEDDGPASKTRPTTKSKQTAAVKEPLRSKLKLGEKRAKPADDDIESDESGQIIEKPKPKARKTSKPKKTSAPKKKPAVKKEKPPKPQVYKLGKWNPDIEIIDIDPAKTGNEKEIRRVCCKRCSAKNIHRAIWTKDFVLLKKLMMDFENVASCTAHWGPDDMRRPIDILLEEGLLTKTSKFLELLITPPVKEVRGASSVVTSAQDDYAGQLRNFHSRYKEPYLLDVVKTGEVSSMAYGARIRSVEMTRGGRQGNNAFLEY